MDEIGLFPLGIVLLPTEQIPLHIFEERYKELIGECLDQDEEFGLVLADDDGIRPVGTRAAVIEVTERLDDGRLNIVIEGRERFRLRELTEGRSFHTGDVEAIEDQDDPAEAADVEEALRLFAKLLGSPAPTSRPRRPSTRCSPSPSQHGSSSPRRSSSSSCRSRPSGSG